MERFRQAVYRLNENQASRQYYEVKAEACASAGLRYRIACPTGGYKEYDTKDARSEGPLADWPGTDWFDIYGLGRPACLPHVAELLQKEAVGDFEAEPVSSVLRSIVEYEEM
jgi:hypothetical protein